MRNLFFTAVLFLNGCGLIAAQIDQEQNALVVNVEDVDVRFNIDFASGACRGNYMAVTGVNFGSIGATTTCKVVRFRPQVTSLSERLRLVKLAIATDTRLGAVELSDEDILRVNERYLSNVGPGVLYPAQFIIPVIRAE